MSKILLKLHPLIATFLMAVLLVLATPGSSPAAFATTVDYGTSYHLTNNYGQHTYLDSPNVRAAQSCGGYQCDKGWENKYVFDVGAESMVVEGINGRHSTPERALETRPTSQSITVEEATDVNFYVQEDNPDPRYGNPANNLGGVSLQITPQ